MCHQGTLVVIYYPAGKKKVTLYDFPIGLALFRNIIINMLLDMIHHYVTRGIHAKKARLSIN